MSGSTSAGSARATRPSAQPSCWRRPGPALVNAGGDIAVHGGSWPVGVETAEGELTLELTGGGLATSGRDRRHWRRNGESSTT